MIVNRILTTAASAGMAAVLLSTSIVAPAQNRQRTRHTRFSAGTVIPVKLDESLSSRDAREGDKFTATVTDDSNYADVTSLPPGTRVEGVVQSVKAKEGKQPGTLDLSFNRVTLPNGRSYSINGTPIALDSKSVVRKNGHLVAKSGKKGPNRLTYVGIGAGAGLLVNVLGHRKGTLTDVLIGAGLGYAAGSLIKGGNTAKDVELKSGTAMGVSLNRSLALGR